MTFDGFPEAALDFYDDLEADNTKTFWTENRHRYDEFVAAPAKAFVAALGDEFGQAKIFRPYRDVRFAKDKTPYKTHQGIFVAIGPALGYYLQIGAPGIATGAGFYDASPARVASLREAIWSRSSRRSSRPGGSGAASGSRPRPAGTTPSTLASTCCATRP